ncbi:hypothetical protein HMPREF1869_01238 [Bacteroidales bacterium KA00251]|nr:hypothetical protein HMPREF1869_01238 [Bacteroidales bacterium KA00251]
MASPHLFSQRYSFKGEYALQDPFKSLFSLYSLTILVSLSKEIAVLWSPFDEGFVNL